MSRSLSRLAVLGCFAALSACAMAEDPADPGVADPTAADPGAAAEPRAERAAADIGYTSHVHVMPVSRDGQRVGAAATAALTANLTFYGGPVLQHVKVVQVNWGSGVSYSAQLAQYYTDITNSAYFDWLSEYNTTSPPQSIGRGTFGGVITDGTVSSSNSITDAQIQTQLSSLISLGTVPAPTADTLYMVHFPPGKTITESGGNQSCSYFCAYHGTYTRNGQYIYYGVIPDQGGACAGGCGGSASQFDNTTSVASHELIEAVTDAAVGLATVYGPPLAWYDQTNGEIGDICNASQGSITVNGTPYIVQKEWSNAKNACIVTNGTAPPPPTNDFSIATSAASVSLTAGGTSATLTITTAVTTGSAGPVSLSVSGLPTGVTGSLSSSSVNAGGSATLTLTAGATAVSGTTAFVVSGTEGTVAHTVSPAPKVVVSGGTPPPPTGGTLTNGVPVTGLSAATNGQLAFSLVVPSGATAVTFTISGGTGDADLYLKRGSAPTLTSYDYRPYKTGNSESVVYPDPATAGTYYVMLVGYAAFSGVTLTGSYKTGTTPPPTGTVLGNNVPVTGLSGASGSWKYFTITVPAGATNLKFNTSLGTGDGDLYVRFGAQPTTSTYDYRPYLTGNTESVTVTVPATGTYYVGIRGYTSYSGMQLVAKYTP